FLLFFFQAEDGIRDATVTGVQTCALPISTSRRNCSRSGFGEMPTQSIRACWEFAWRIRALWPSRSAAPQPGRVPVTRSTDLTLRSEEPSCREGAEMVGGGEA